MTIEKKPAAVTTENFVNGGYVKEKFVVALFGSPNSGKTTLFNWLTGSRYKTVNYPGATVEYSVGGSHPRYGETVLVMDTPGTYSMLAKSPDEKVAVEAVYRHKEFGVAKVVISVVDATQMSRHLFLTKQLQEAGFRVVVALTMMDIVRARGEQIDLESMSKELGCPVVAIDGRLGGGVVELFDVVRTVISFDGVPHVRELKHWTHEHTEAVMQKNAELQAKVLSKNLSVRADQIRDARLKTQKIDRVLLHPVWGLLFFALVMGLLFTSIFWAAQPLMDAVDGGFSWIGAKILEHWPDSLWADFVANGVIASFGGVFVFVPQILILFLGIIAFEDSGYLARSATLMDKPFSKLGLNGRSFVPLLSGYACAVPAMMAARTITSRRERWITLFVIPLMSCSARLPVYALLLSFLFRGAAAWKAGLMLTGIYLASLLVGAIAAAIVNRFLQMSDKSWFMLELPLYRRPDLSTVLRSAYNRTLSYVKRAGPPIFTFALVIWLATTFPNFQESDKALRLQGSYAAQVGVAVEPIFKPMGLDWRVGVGLISAFAAREVFVSSLAVMFGVSDDNTDSMQQGLLSKMSEAKTSDGHLLFTVSSVLGLVLFFMIALQCLSTVAMAVREAGSWKFALLQLAVFNIVAYVLTILLVQGLRALGVA